MDARPSHPSSLRARLTVTVAIAVALALAVIGALAVTMTIWQDALGARSEARTARLEMSELTRAITEQDTSIRGFVAAREEQFVEGYLRAVVLERAMLDRLGARETSSRPEFAAQLERLSVATDRWRADVASVALDPDRPTPAPDLAAERYEEVSDALAALDTLVADELNRSVDRTESVRRLSTGVLVGAAIVAVGSIVLVGLLFRRWVTRPLAGIGAAARRMAVDDTAEWPDVDTAELQEVTDAIRGLQRSLTRERDRALTAYRGLEQSALLALHVRSELANELGDPPPGWSIGSALVPAEGVVAGDCYDSGLLDQRHLYAIMIDVTGHGALAALDALKVKTQLRAALRSRLAPGAALDWLARQNRRGDEIELFTAVVLVIDVATGECRYANAGHPPPVLTDGNEHVPLAGTGPLLGAFAASWATETVMIEPGHTLVLYTDGVTEAVNRSRERFGEQRLADGLRSAPVTDAAALVDRVIAAVDDFRDGPRSDDVTLLVVHRATWTASLADERSTSTDRQHDPSFPNDSHVRPMDTVQS
jgi:sigma-B regulation protein RsbU (phosphoserine phosphatase)